MKIAIALIKITFENSIKVQIFKMQCLSLSPYIKKTANIWWKMLMSAELKDHPTWFIYFLDLL